MKNLMKLVPILIGITAIADTHFDLLLQLGLSNSNIALIRLIGLILALFLPSVKQTFAREKDGSGGGAIAPNKAP